MEPHFFCAGMEGYTTGYAGRSLWVLSFQIRSHPALEWPRNGGSSAEDRLSSCLHRWERYKVHRIIAATFCVDFLNGESVDGMIVRHINHNPSDNRHDNLEYCTVKEARVHAVDIGAVEPVGGQAVEQISPEEGMLDYA